MARLAILVASAVLVSACGASASSTTSTRLRIAVYAQGHGGAVQHYTTELWPSRWNGAGSGKGVPGPRLSRTSVRADAARDDLLRNRARAAAGRRHRTPPRQARPRAARRPREAARSSAGDGSPRSRPASAAALDTPPARPTVRTRISLDCDAGLAANCEPRREEAHHAGQAVALEARPPRRRGSRRFRAGGRTRRHRSPGRNTGRARSSATRPARSRMGRRSCAAGTTRAPSFASTSVSESATRPGSTRSYALRARPAARTTGTT